MINHDQLLPEEIQEQTRNLVQDLGHYYDTSTEDMASMERIRERLLQKTAASLPVSDTDTIIQFPRASHTQHKRDTRPALLHPLKNRTRHHYLNTLVAAALVIIILGSFALILQWRQGADIGSRLPQTNAAHGWSIIATFHGTGDQTITRQHIEAGHKFGWLLICPHKTDGWIKVTFEPNYIAGEGACSTITTGLLKPDSILESPTVLPPIQNIKVISAASTSWQLLLFKGTYYPPLEIDKEANWHTLHDEMKGTGTSTWQLDSTLPKTWALEYICHGTGKIQIKLQSGDQSNAPGISGATSICNGQTQFDVSEMAEQNPSTVRQIQITTSADNDWQIVLLGCAGDQAYCGIATMPSTPKP